MFGGSPNGKNYRPHGGGRGNPPPRKLTPADQVDALAAMIAQLEEKTGFTVTERRKVIEDGQTFRQWVDQLAADGLKVDGKPFTLADRPAMAYLYDQIPSTEDEAYRLVLVMMKCAQVGFTVFEMLAAIYLGLRFGPATVGMFLPDINLAGIKSTERFMPIVRSVPKVHELMTQDAADGSGRKTGEGNVNRRRIDQALFIFSWTSGKATTESIPMDVLSFDEVQEMTLGQIEKTIERLSASPIRFTQMGSTANWPDLDIHWWFKKGSQLRFQTRCPECDSAKPLDEYFPDCIRFDEGKRIYRYVCPNGHWINDTQHGTWVADNPDADPPIDLTIPKKDRPLRIRSMHFPQFLSPTIAAGEILDAYRNAEDMKNFFNRKLGKPYLDPSQVPVTLEHCHAAEAAGIAAGLVWKQRARGTFMGIDQMGRFNVVVLKERMPDGRQATIHVEEIYAAKPFDRCSELMDSFGVQCCVVEINPNYNDAHEFAQKHLGRVFLCDSFGEVKDGMIAWGDAPKLSVSDRRTNEEARDRYTLRMDQYKCMQVSMMRIVNGACLFPDRKQLEQEVIEGGVRQRAQILPRMWHHFTKTALVAELVDEKGTGSEAGSGAGQKSGTNKYRRRVKKIGIDPHFSYANMLCDVAWARAHGTATFILPDTKAPTAMKPAEQLRAAGMPATVVAMIEHRETMLSGEVCGRCTAYKAEDSTCGERGGMRVNAQDPGCALFVVDELAPTSAS